MAADLAAPAAGAPAAGTPAAGELRVQGFAALRRVEVSGQPSWREGGFGRLLLGVDDPEDESAFGFGQLHLAFDWQPRRSFGAYLHAVARAEPSRLGGRELGIVEAYLHGETDVGETGALRFRLGHFLLPTSREKVEVAWSLPYTLTFSALNTWIGEELRVTGLGSEYAWAPSSSGIDELRLGAVVYGGNDASGSLLAWRGWRMGDRITAFREVVPLPPLAAEQA